MSGNFHQIEHLDNASIFVDDVFVENNKNVSQEWVSIRKLYPNGADEPLLPETFSREQFGQGNHYECFMLSALSTLIRFPDIIRNCFVTKEVRQDGRYTFQFFRGREWVKVEIDDTIALEDGEVLYIQSPTEHWWPLLLEKAYAKFYMSYDHLEGCTLQETYHDLTGNPVLNIPMDAKLAKAANAEVTEGSYWLDLAQKIQAGQLVASVLTKDMDVENMGLQREQQYGVLEIFSITGTSSVNDIVIRLHNPFEDEEYEYKGPLNRNDAAWTPKLRTKYSVDDVRSIFLPLNTFLKIMNSLQLCFVDAVEREATYFYDEWKGETAGGNPTSVTWRKNPLYYVRNTGTTPAEIIVVIKQEDQRRYKKPETDFKYLQCGVVLVQYVYSHPLPTFYITGNNHKLIYKSLFLNSREVANTMTIPPNSLCYLVPSCMLKGAEGEFSLAVYGMKNVDYDDLTIKKLVLPNIEWDSPANRDVVLRQKEKDRVDFYVDKETDVHILMHQQKPFISKTGGDAMTEDYMGMYLYDDRDHKISGVHAATNFREVSIIHHLPRSGRYALSITCPRAKDEVPAFINIVGSSSSNLRIVDAPADATMFDDDDEIIEEGDGGAEERNPIDYLPVTFEKTRITEAPDSNTPFEDKRFMVNNKNVTDEPWVHIGDLYPEGKKQPLLPEILSRDQFEQGEHYECCCLTAFAAVVDHHPDVIRSCFITKNPRKDGRYTFQFHRYGHWVKIEIDDRIPLSGGNTLYCRSPTRHWWPLLLEKAYAKFYTLYQNIEGCTQQEVLHDFTGRPVISIPTDLDLAKAALYDVDDAQFWLDLNEDLQRTAIAALTRMEKAEPLGMQDDQSYSVLGFVPMRNATDLALSEILVKLYNPFEESTYTGPMNRDDAEWPEDMRVICAPEDRHFIYMPVNIFREVFLNMQQVLLGGLVEPSHNFHSEWADGTNGGNPTLVTWRENPLYLVRNTAEEPLQIIAMIRQPDKRHLLHRQTVQELNYIQCGMILVQSTGSECLPTYLVTGNNHRTVHKGLFFNSREVANVVTVPAQSVCYLVPSAMLREKSKFILSYWNNMTTDSCTLAIQRLQVDVARKLPAVTYLMLKCHANERVDFFVDTPTDAHILLSQLDAKQSETITSSFLGIQLYNASGQRIGDPPTVTNLRDTGLVAHLNVPGYYTLWIKCPKAKGSVPCRVEVVCIAEAHVRITDNPDEVKGAPCIGETSELISVPDSFGLSGVQRSMRGQSLNEALPSASISEGQPELDAILPFLKSHYRRIPISHLRLLHNLRFAEKLRKHEELTASVLETNASHIHVLEDEMNGIADELACEIHDVERRCLKPDPEGVPLELLTLDDDLVFTDIENDLRMLKMIESTDYDAIKLLEQRLEERVNEQARDLKTQERALFLNPTPLGVPISRLALDDNVAFHTREVERLRLRQEAFPNEEKIRALNKELNSCAEELALKNLEHDRGYMELAYLHVAREDLPLNSTPNFIALECERRAMLDSPLKNEDGIASLEKRLNIMATGMAAALLAQERLEYLPQVISGRPVEELPLNENDSFLRLERERRDELKNPRRVMRSVIIMEDRLNEMANAMARALNAADRPSFMKPAYHGIGIEQLPLDECLELVQLEAERARLYHCPSRKYELLQVVENSIHECAEKLAQQKLRTSKDYLKSCYAGVPLALLPLDTDEVFRLLDEERTDLLSRPLCDMARLDTVEKQIDEQLQKLALAYKAARRSQYTTFVSCHSGTEFSFNNDQPFSDMECKMFSLMAEDSTKHKEQINDLQVALQKRAHELKQLQRQRFREALDQAPLGICLDEIDLDTDDEFLEIENQIHQATRDNTDEPNRTSLFARLQFRAYELAAIKLAQHMPFLDTMPCNIPLCYLPGIGKNEVFWKFRAEEQYLEKTNMLLHQFNIEALRNQMNRQVRELARQKKLADRVHVVGDLPGGVPLEDVDLDSDPTYVTLEREWRQKTQQDPRGNASSIRDLEEKMRARAALLGEEQRWADRYSCIDSHPEGVALREVALDSNPDFLEAEAVRRELLADPRRNAKKLAAVEKQLNDYAHALAWQKKVADREGLLGAEPEGVPLAELCLDEDEAFRGLEDEWRGLAAADTQGNNPQLRQLQDLMTERVRELARQKKLADRVHVVGDLPGGVPLEDVDLDSDPTYVTLEREWRQKTQQDPRGNASSIRDLEEKMRARAALLGEEQRWADRYSCIDSHPEGVALREVALDSNPDFLEAEAVRRELLADPRRNAKKLAAVEKQLNDYAHALAWQKKVADREGLLGAEPEGVPLAELCLDEDEAFRGLEDEWRGLAAADTQGNNPQLRQLQDLMTERVRELARQKKLADRVHVVGDLPGGVPLEDVDLDSDPTYVTLEREWRQKTQQDPRGNASSIRDLEEKMRARAALLGEEQRWADRYSCIDSHPEGVALREVALDSNPDFLEAEAVRRELLADPRRNAKKLAAVEKQLNDYAHALAWQKKVADREGLLGAEPEGVPLAELCLDEDEAFRGLEDEWRGLAAADTQGNNPQLRQLQDLMTERVRELARQKKLADRVHVVGDLPGGVPLEDVDLDSDPTYVTLEREWRQKTQQDPRGNASSIRDLEEKMRARAALLGEEQRWADRYSCIDSHPEGVALREVALDSNPDFLEAEAVRRELLADPRRNAKKLAAVEKQLNDYAHALAWQKKVADREGLLGAEPEGVPLAELCLDEDEAFRGLEDEWRGLAAADTQGNNPQLRQLQDLMTERVRELARQKKLADRVHVVGDLPGGVPLEDVDLDSDPTYVTLEREWRQKTQQDPRGNASSIRDLEEKMRARAALLGEEQRWADRYSCIDSHPEGVALREVALDSNPDFLEAEAVRRELLADPRRNAKKLAAVEKQLNDYAHALAWQKKVADREGLLGAEPEGVPLAELCLDEDEAFRGLEDEWRGLAAADTQGNNPQLRQLQDLMTERVRELARQKKLADRVHVVGDLPGGVPLEDVDLDSDPTYVTLEREWRQKTQQDPRGNASSIRDLEEKMRARAALLGEEQRWADRYSCIDSHPEGVALREVALDSNPDFLEAEAVRRELLADPRRNAKKLAAVEKQLNDYAHALAWQKKVADREGLLGAEPEGVPLAELCLDEDEAFRGLEDEWRGLAAADTQGNNPQLRQLQDLMTERVRELARQKKLADRVHVVGDLPGGVPLEDVDLDSDPTYVTLEREWRQKTQQDPRGNASSIRDLEEKMRARAALLGEEQRWADRYSCIDSHPEGVALREVALDSNPDFLEAEAVRRELLADPRRNAKKLAAVEKQLNDYAHALAWQKKVADREGLLGAEPEGVPLAELCLDEDEAFRGLEDEWRGLAAADTQGNNPQLRQLQDLMTERVRELARQKKLADRVHVVSDLPGGVPLEDVDLDSDPTYVTLEREWRQKTQQDPRGNASSIRDLEEKMRARAALLGEEQRWADRYSCIDSHPEGVALREVALDSNPDFLEAEAVRRELLADPRRNAKKLAAVEKQLNDYAHALAWQKKVADREGLLGAEPEGVPLAELCLDEDEAFRGLEDEWRGLAAADTQGNNPQLRQLQDLMTERVRELARQKKLADRVHVVGDLPGGVPLEDVDLDSDPTYVTLEREWRQKTQQDPRGNASSIRDLEEKMRARAALLGEEQRWADRYSCIDSHPEGVALREVALDSNPDFLEAEAVRRELLADPRRNAKKLAAVEKQLNDYAHALAWQKKVADREGLLGAEPEGVPLAELCLDEDEAFRGLEDEWRGLAAADTQGNNPQLRQLQDLMTERVRELARQKKLADRVHVVGDLPGGVPLEDVDLDSDPTYVTLEREWRQKTQQDPRGNASSIRDLEEKMRARAALLGEEQRWADRYSCIDSHPEGVALREVALDSNPDFLEAEAVRRELLADPRRNAKKLAAVEKQLNDYAHALAWQKKVADREGLLGAEPEGVPLAELCLDEDEAFRGLEDEWRGLAAADTQGNNPQLRQLQDLMTERVRELARQKKLADRVHVVGDLPGGVPLEDVDLDSDPTYVTLEREWRQKTQQDPRGNASSIRDLEEKMRARAALLGEEQRWADRYSCIDSHPEGVALREVALDSNPDFLEAEAVRRELLADPRRNAKKLAAVEKQLNDYAHALAWQKKVADREGLLGAEPEGVPLAELCLDEDEAFRGLEDEWRGLAAADTQGNNPQLRQLQDLMTERVRELARQKKLADRVHVVGDLPGGVPLEDVDLDSDPTYVTLEREWRQKTQQDPRGNASSIRDLEEKMRARAALLGEEQRWADRYSCIDSHPEGVALREVALDSNPDFLEAEAVRRELLADPRRNAKKLAAVEKQLNDYAHALAWQKKVADREGLLGAEPEGVPLAELCLDEDEAFRGLEDEWRGLAAADTQGNNPQLRQLQDLMTERVRELARQKKLADRVHVVGDLPGGVPLEDVDLDSDPTYVTLEREWRQKTQQDPRGNASSIRDLEEKMRARAALLGEEQRWADRYSCIDSHPEGVALREVALDSNPDFLEAEAVRRELLADPRRNAKKLAAVEKQLNDYAHALAWQKKVADREGLLGAEPEGVPLAELCLDEDEAFRGLEDEWRGLAAADTQGNNPQLRQLQDLMTERVRELARQKKLADRVHVVGDLPGGVPLEDVDLDSDPTYVTLEREWRQKTQQDPRGNASSIRDLEEKMRARAALLGEEQRWADRYSCIDSHPEGVALREVALDSNPDFLEAEAVRRELLADPRRNAKKLAAVEKQLNDYAHALAWQKKVADREGLLGAEPEGVPLAELCLDEDEAFRGLEDEWRGLAAADTQGNNPQLRQLQDLMTERVRELARQKKLADRVHVVGDLPGGVPLEDVDLDSDPTYVTLEREWRQKTQQDPRGNASSIRDLEEKMRARAALLGEEQRWADRYSCIDSHPEGVALREVALDSNPDFLEAEAVRRELLADPRRNAKKLAAVEKQLNDYAHALAWQKKVADREGLLGAEPEGVPLAELCLDEDEAFRGLEDEWRGLAAADTQGNNPQLRQLQDLMTERVRELARQKKLADRVHVVGDLPGGVPLEDVDLDSDPTYVTLEREWRQKTQQDPRGNASSIRDLEEKMRARAALLGEEQRWADRYSCIDSHPEGVALREVALDSNPDFLEAEAVRRELLADPRRNAKKLAAVEKQLNDYAHALAWQKKVADREGLLGAEPEGVPLAELCLDEDEAFRGLEDEWRGLAAADTQGNNPQLRQLQDLMTERVRELARQKKLADRVHVVGDLPGGVPLEDVDLDSDPTYVTLEREWRQKTQQDPRGNASSIRDLEEKMRARAALLGEEQRWADRYSCIDSHPEGVALREVALDSNPDFLEAEAVRRELLADPRRNAKKLAAVEKQLNDYAHALAWQKKVADREGLLGAEPEGVPLAELCLDEDEAFRGLEDEWRGLAAADTQGNNPQLRQLQDLMTERVRELARQKKLADRVHVVGDLPGGVPLEDVDLDSDPTYVTLEREWRQKTQQDPRGNASSIRDLEEKMRARAALLGEEQRWADRYSCIDSHPEGVALREVALDSNPDFLEAEAVRRELLADPRRNAKKLAAVEKQLNDYAHALAWQKKVADREGLLGAEPEGVPLAELCLDEDEAFRGLEDEWRGLAAADTQGNNPQLRQLQDLMTERVRELALDAKLAAMDFLDKVAEGISVFDFNLFADDLFATMSAEREALLAADPVRNAAAVEALEAKMNTRVRELAKDVKMIMSTFLAPMTAVGIPTRDVPFTCDHIFRSLLEERGDVLESEGEGRRSEELVAMMQMRVEELALDMKMAKRLFLKDSYHGIARAMIPMDADPKFLAMEEERQALLSTPTALQGAEERVRELEAQMNDLVEDLAKALRSKERAFLDPHPAGVSLSQLRLDADKTFLDLEAERDRLTKENALRNAEQIMELERAMNDRVQKMAQLAKARRRAFLERQTFAMPLECIALDEDSIFLGMEREMVCLQKEHVDHASAIAVLEHRMIDRVHTLVSQQKQQDRTRILGAALQHLAVDTAILDLDATFTELEFARYQQFGQDSTAANEERIAELTDAMRARARELAATATAAATRTRTGPSTTVTTSPAGDAYWATRQYLSSDLEGISCEASLFDHDAEFAEKEKQLCESLADPRTDAAVIDELVQCLRARAKVLVEQLEHEGASALGKGEREILTDQMTWHPYSDYCLLSRQRSKERREALSQSGVLELKAGTSFLQERVFDEGGGGNYAFLDPKPEGLPLRMLKLHQDAVFRRLDLNRCSLCDDLAEGRLHDVTLIHKAEQAMNDRAHVLAKEFLAAHYGEASQPADVLRGEYQGVPLRDLELCHDASVQAALRVHFLLHNSPDIPSSDIQAVLDALHQHADMLAKAQLERERAVFLPNKLRGISLEALPLNYDPVMQALEHKLRVARREGCPREQVKTLEEVIRQRADQLAGEYKHARRQFLDPSPLGVPLDQLHLDSDSIFLAMESKLWDTVVGEPNNSQTTVELEKCRMSAYVEGKARVYLDQQRCRDAAEAPAADEPQRKKKGKSTERGVEEPAKTRHADVMCAALQKEQLIQPEPPQLRGVTEEKPDAGSPALWKSRRNGAVRVSRRRPHPPDQHVAVAAAGAEAALAATGAWQDAPFHAANCDVAELWRRIADVYPDGLRVPLVPQHPCAADVSSQPRDLSYIGPFLAALSRQPPLLQRLFNTRTHVTNGSYRFTFFDPDSNPVQVNVDDRVPCDATGNPRFTMSPSHSWWPLLLEKAYARFVGSFERMDDCTPHETLRDLTGRPVTHIPLDPTLAKEVYGCAYRDARFWRAVRANLDRGDVYIAMSKNAAPDGIHSWCHYAIFDVIETVPGSRDPADIVIKLHTCYRDTPSYTGPLHPKDTNWTPALRAICAARPEEESEFLYLPQPVFLRNFSSMQRCHINCGDRLTVAGEWDGQACGGNPKNTTFRNNPIYLVQNQSNRNAVVLVELRHAAPVFYDAHHAGVYYPTGLALLRQDSSMPHVAPLLAYNTHSFLYKGLITDGREVCVEMELPANTQCYLVPYTKKKGSRGKFNLSIYPKELPLNFSTLQPISQTHTSLETQIVVHPGSGEDARVDFAVNELCDVHLLLHQNKITDPASVRRGDYLAEDVISMTAYENKKVLVSTTGTASNAREHGMTFQAVGMCRYTLLVNCPAKPVTGDCPCTITICAPRHVQCRLLPIDVSKSRFGATLKLLPPILERARNSAPSSNKTTQQPSQGLRRPTSLNGIRPQPLKTCTYLH